MFYELSLSLTVEVSASFVSSVIHATIDVPKSCVLLKYLIDRV